MSLPKLLPPNPSSIHSNTVPLRAAATPVWPYSQTVPETVQDCAVGSVGTVGPVGPELGMEGLGEGATGEFPEQPETCKRRGTVTRTVHSHRRIMWRTPSNASMWTRVAGSPYGVLRFL